MLWDVLLISWKSDRMIEGVPKSACRSSWHINDVGNDMAVLQSGCCCRDNEPITAHCVRQLTLIIDVFPTFFAPMKAIVNLLFWAPLLPSPTVAIFASYREREKETISNSSACQHSLPIYKKKTENEISLFSFLISCTLSTELTINTHVVRISLWGCKFFTSVR